MNCRIAAPWVTALGSGDEVTFVPVRTHIGSCLYCQASVARQRRLRRSLEDLATVDGAASIVDLSRPTAERLSSRRPVVLGAVGAALAVGIGVIGLRRSLVH